VVAKKSSVIRGQRDFRWKGVRYVLFAGSRGDPISFDVRYFEIEAGGHSTFEQHRHAHVVIGLRGAGRVRIGSRWQPVTPFDVCYIAPRTAHQLRNEAREPFGFLCLVDAKRDRGKPVVRSRRSRGG
jgi:ribulose-bisphosphate carboxylase large chain